MILVKQILSQNTIPTFIAQEYANYEVLILARKHRSGNFGS